MVLLIKYFIHNISPLSLIARFRKIEKGIFRRDTYMTILQIIGSCVLYANAHENIKNIISKVYLLCQEMIEKYTESAIKLMLSGVLA